MQTKLTILGLCLRSSRPSSCSEDAAATIGLVFDLRVYEVLRSPRLARARDPNGSGDRRKERRMGEWFLEPT